MTEGVAGTIGTTAPKDAAQKLGVGWIRFLCFTEKQRRLDAGQDVLALTEATKDKP